MVRIYIATSILALTILCSCKKKFSFKFTETNVKYEKAVKEVFIQIDTTKQDDKSIQINYTLGYLNNTDIDKDSICSIVSLLEFDGIDAIFLMKNKYVLFEHLNDNFFNEKRYYLVYNLDDGLKDYFGEYQIIKIYNKNWTEIKSENFKW
jgi:uncharacterized protein YsxB (DUF464 family)